MTRSADKDTMAALAGVEPGHYPAGPSAGLDANYICYRCVMHPQWDDADDCAWSIHHGCPVVLVSSSPAGTESKVCKCNCQDCKRAWFQAGQPLLKNGKVIYHR